MNSPLNICMTSDDVLPAVTGVGAHVQRISKELAARGHRISILTTRRKGEPETEKWHGVTLHRMFTVKIYGFNQALPSSGTITRLIQRESPDFIHHHYLGILMKRTGVIAENLNIPQLSTYHFSSEVLTQPLFMRPFKRLIQKQVIACNNRVQMLIAPSQSTANVLKLESPHIPVRYITNPVGFSDQSNVRPAARNSAFTILYAGRLAHEKNIQYLLNGFQRMLASVPEAVLWIAGEGPMRSTLEKHAHKLGIASRVQFLGFLDAQTLATRYAACDLFVLPSLVETQGLVALEAMWFQKPIIVTDAIGCSAELVAQGDNGYIVDPASPADLAQRMAHLAGNPALRKQMGLAGRKRVMSAQTERVVDQLEEVYGQVCAQRVCVA